MSTTSIQHQVQEVPLIDIKISRNNVRKDFNDEGIEDLAESVKKFGQLQPVLLLGTFGKPPYELIVGQRRYNAVSKLNKPSILAVFNDKLTSIDAIVVSLAENLQRSNLTYKDMSNAITKIYDHYRDAKKVANILSITTSTVYEYLKIEKVVTPEIKSYMTTNNISKEDLKRSVKIAKGDKSKILNTLKEISKLSKYQKDRAIDIMQEEPESNIDRIIDKAKKPRVTTTIVLSLSVELNKALEDAKTKLREDGEAIALKALRVWLIDNGFIA